MDILTRNRIQLVNEYRKLAAQFIDELPYLKSPYNSRQWGNAWHSLCSYHGKLKPSIAHFLISWFSKKGDKVLDPMSGVGTIPFEACLQGRIGIGNDLSELAYVVTKAKLEKPIKDEVDHVIKSLNTFIESFKQKYDDLEEVPYSEFGLNKSIPTYFHLDTYSEIIAARKFFLNRIKEITPAEAMVLSSFLHVLHGNRPYALSRRSHPLTPYAPKGDFEYKKVIDHIERKVGLSYKRANFNDFKVGKSIFGDLFDLSSKVDNVDVIITSPPFVNSIRFYSSNWMRLWLTGWEPEDFKNADKEFLEGKQKSNINIYYDFFKVSHRLLKENGKMVLHLGKSEKCNMGVELSELARDFFDVVYLGSENVSLVEKHGIRDKGGTVDHQFLFLMKK